MLNLCSKCNRPLEDDDAIMFSAVGVYHKLPSTRAWAIEKGSIEADVRSIKHVQCAPYEGD